jgi:hypothetical protein
MVLTGLWLVCDDGITRPVIRAKVLGNDGTFYAETFLVDSCADRTVLSAAVLRQLGTPADQSNPGFTLQGVGGASDSVLVRTVLEFPRTDGNPARVRGEYAAFTNPEATDLSILGRDVLDIFDLIISRRRNEILLLTGNHQYRVE